MNRPHMRKVRSRNTTPELRLRKLIYGMGYRGYRVHYGKLPGKPDIVFPGRKRVVFVHGCFWHGHDCKAGRNVPKSNLTYWTGKLAGNKARDERHAREIKKAGWKILVIWECEMKDESVIRRKLERFLRD